MIEKGPKGGEKPKKPTAPGNKWIDAADFLRDVEDQEYDGGGRFSEVTKARFPSHSRLEGKKDVGKQTRGPRGVVKKNSDS